MMQKGEAECQAISQRMTDSQVISQCKTQPQAISKRKAESKSTSKRKGRGSKMKPRPLDLLPAVQALAEEHNTGEVNIAEFRSPNSPALKLFSASLTAMVSCVA